MNDVSFDRDPLADYMIAKLVRKSPGKLVFMELYDLPLRFDLLFGRPLFLCFTTRNEAVRMMEEELPEFGVFDLVATAITRVLPGRLASYTLMAALWIRDTLNPFARFYR